MCLRVRMNMSLSNADYTHWIFSGSMMNVDNSWINKGRTIEIYVNDFQTKHSLDLTINIANV